MTAAVDHNTLCVWTSERTKRAQQQQRSVSTNSSPPSRLKISTQARTSNNAGIYAALLPHSRAHRHNGAADPRGTRNAKDHHYHGQHEQYLNETATTSAAIAAPEQTPTTNTHQSSEREKAHGYLALAVVVLVVLGGIARALSTTRPQLARSLVNAAQKIARPPTYLKRPRRARHHRPRPLEQRSIVRAGVRSAAPTFSNVIVAQRVKERGKRIEHSATGAQKPAPRVGSKSPRLACPPNATISCSKRNPRAYGAHAPSYPCFPPFRFFSPAPLLTHNRSLARALVRSLDRARFDRA